VENVFGCAFYSEMNCVSVRVSIETSSSTSSPYLIRQSVCVQVQSSNAHLNHDFCMLRFTRRLFLNTKHLIIILSLSVVYDFVLVSENGNLNF